MIDLKCKCTTCCYNKNSNCSAENIFVSKSTTCNSYLARRSSDAEFADEIAQPLIRPSVEVECHARCVFSRDGICVANGITIGDLNNNATCETFLKE